MQIHVHEVIIIYMHFVLLIYLMFTRGQRNLNGTHSSSSSPGATQPIVGVYFTALYRALASSRARLLDHTQRRATVGRTPLNE